LRGNPGRRPLNDKEPKGRPLSKRAPRNLSEGAGYFWRKYIPKLVDMGVPFEVDEPALIITAEAWALAIESRANLDKEGTTTVDEKGLVRKHPDAQIWRDNAGLFLKGASLFGMTASDRSKVRIEEEDQLGLYAEFFAKVTPPPTGDALAEFGDDE
jgi:P27 family predicted phage terminase small subunit